MIDFFKNLDWTQVAGFVAFIGALIGGSHWAFAIKLKKAVKEIKEFGIESAQFIELLSNMPKNPTIGYWDKLRREGSEAMDEFKDVIELFKRQKHAK